MSNKLLDLIDELYVLIREARTETGHDHGTLNEAIGGAPSEQEAEPSVFDDLVFANSNSLPSGSNLGAAPIGSTGLVNFCGVFSGNTSSVDNTSDEATASLDEPGGGTAAGIDSLDLQLLSHTDPDGASDVEPYRPPMVTIEEDCNPSEHDSQCSSILQT